VTYAVVTLGCKLNQADSAAVAGRLGGDLLAVPMAEADIVILNTCTVTHKADRDARRLVRSVRRANPGALLAVMGCATRRDAEAFRAMPEVDAVLDSTHALERFLEGHAPAEGPDGLRREPFFGDRTRALLKVQEGCDFPCAYCIVPAVRGPSRSVAPERVEQDLAALLDAGYKEVVLTGINTGEYGKDLGWGGGLPALLGRLFRLPGRYRLRLNSVEPRAVTPDLIDLLQAEPRLCRHLQIPLQSGSDGVLADMRRNYRAGFYRDLVQTLVTEVTGIGLGADVLVGFPTETPRDFDATLALLAESPLAFVHAFSYSSRPGTPAGLLPALSPKIVAERAARVRALGQGKKDAFLRSFAGAEMEALTLLSEGGRGRALTGNFLDVTIDEPVPPNHFIRLRIADPSGGKVGARVVTRPE
jgi:threonylcarbamoyladenosine tRNA methylthiotransferase MtaB